MNGKISWCMKQEKGIRLVEPKEHLAKSYMEEADETFENFLKATGKWKVIMAYYACYSALYSILMKCGIKSEIHECTIELMGMLGFGAGDVKLMKSLKADRIKTQYYLEKIELKAGEQEKVRAFILECKSKAESLTSPQIKSIRDEIGAAGCRGAR